MSSTAVVLTTTPTLPKADGNLVETGMLKGKYLGWAAYEHGLSSH